MTTKQLVFLDTSVQIRRTLSEPADLQQIDAVLNRSTIQLVCSAYVWMEYQRTVIADLASIHQLMFQYNEWGSIFRHILDGSRSFRPRSAVRCTQMVGKLYTDSAQDLETARYTIIEQITHSLRQKFWTNVHAVSDSIVCNLVTKGIARQSDRTYAVPTSCRKENATCHLPQFLHEHQTKLHTLADYLANHPHVLKEQTRLERLLAAIIENPQTALGQASCWPLGDVIIALQVPPGASLWTFDTDFAPIAQALAIPLYRP